MTSLQVDAAGRILNRPGSTTRCHVCRQQVPLNGCVVIGTSSGYGRAYRCAQCSDRWAW